MNVHPYKTRGIKNTRIDVADVLRAIAVIGIILYHSVEHFNTINFNVSHGFSFDPRLFEIAGIVLSGKMYSIFALLFGLSFFIQRDNQEQKGKDFSLRFLWRMILLMGFGMVNMGFYDGDILTSYAIFGLLLIPAGYLCTPVLAAITAVLLAQPFELYHLLAGTERDFSNLWAAYGQIEAAHQNASFFQNFLTDLKYGLYVNLGYDVYVGRVTQIPGLFFLGLLMGRIRLFYNEGNHLRTWRWILGISAAATIAGLVFPFGNLQSWLKPIHNLAMTMTYVSGFVLLWYRFDGFARSMFRIGFFGRMSLSNYFLQSLFGSLIFYGFGLGFWAVTGTLYSLLCGAVMILAQFYILKLWSVKHQRGPLESLWRRLTYLPF